VFFGISINSYENQNINIEGLYLKLDKKLIIQIDKLKIKTNDDNKKFNLKETFDLINHKLLPQLHWFDYIQYITLNELTINEQKFNIDVSKNKISIKSEQFEVDTITKKREKKYTIDIKNLKVPKQHLQISGLIEYDSSKNKINTILDINYKDYLFFINMDYLDDYATFNITSGDLRDLKFVQDFVKLDESIEVWIYKNIKGKYKANTLTFKYYVPDNQFIIESLKAKIDIKDIKIKFKNDLDSINSPKAILYYSDGELRFALGKAKYGSNPLYKSKLYISNLSNKKPIKLTLYLNSTSLLDKNINRILASYDIKLPLIQKDGKTISTLVLDINLKTSKINTKGKFKITNSNFNLSGMDMFITNGTVVLENNLISIKTKDSKLFDKKLLFDIDNITIDTKTKKITGKLYIDSFVLKSGDGYLLDIYNWPTGIKIDFKNDLKISLDKLYTDLHLKDGVANIYIKNLNKFKNNSDLLKQYGIQEGDMLLEFKSATDMKFSLDIYKHESPLMINSLRLFGKIKGDKITINSKNKNISIDIDEKNIDIKIKNVDIDKRRIQTGGDGKVTKKITITGEYSNIIFDEKKAFLSTDYLIIIDKDSFSFRSKFFRNIVNFVKKDNKVVFNLNNGSDVFVNTIVGIGNFIEEGRIDIYGQSIDKNISIFTGDVIVKDTIFVDFATLSSLMSLVNSSVYLINPLLAIPTVFNIIQGDTVFNGYKASYGKIKFKYDLKKEYLSLPQIYTRGGDFNFKGKMDLDFQKRKIDGDIRVIFLKDISNIISSLPIINKIFLGETQEIFLKTYIKGKLDNPNISFTK